MNIDVIYSEILSDHSNKRYIIIDKDTGEILDDAQGYGYKSKQKAFAAYAYKNRDPSKDNIIAKKKKAVKEWCRQNKNFVRDLEEDAFRIAKGSYGPEDKFNAAWVNQAFKEARFTDLPFSATEFLKYWDASHLPIVPLLKFYKMPLFFLYGVGATKREKPTLRENITRLQKDRVKLINR